MERILQLYRARYPVLLLVSHEEERTLAGLEGLAGQEGCEAWRWRATDGLIGPEGAVDGSQELVGALAHIAGLKKPAFFVLHDVESAFDDPLTVRHLRDLAQQRWDFGILVHQALVPEGRAPFPPLRRSGGMF